MTAGTQTLVRFDNLMCGVNETIFEELRKAKPALYPATLDEFNEACERTYPSYEPCGEAKDRNGVSHQVRGPLAVAGGQLRGWRPLWPPRPGALTRPCCGPVFCSAEHVVAAEPAHQPSLPRPPHDDAPARLTHVCHGRRLGRERRLHR